MSDDNSHNAFGGGMLIGAALVIVFGGILIAAATDSDYQKNKYEKVCIWHNGIPYWLQSEQKRVCLDRNTKNVIPDTDLKVPVELDK